MVLPGFVIGAVLPLSRRCLLQEAADFIGVDIQFGPLIDEIPDPIKVVDAGNRRVESLEIVLELVDRPLHGIDIPLGRPRGDGIAISALESVGDGIGLGRV